MTDQGLIGALQQYWNVEPKARLERRNSFFENSIQVDNVTALRFGLVVSVLAIAIPSFWLVEALL